MLITIIFQAGIYFYLDRVILVPSVNFTQSSVKEEPKMQVDPQMVSTDQKYYAKLETNGVKFYTADNKLVKEIPLQDLESVTYFTWVPDTDQALIGISSDTSRGTTVTLKPVNLETNSHPVEPKISGLPRGSRITDVAFSVQDNVTYILVKGKYNTSVYRTDANNNLRLVNINSSIRRIASLQSKDMLLYDNKRNGAVYVYENFRKKRKIISPTGGRYALIGIDKDDNIYIGRLNGSGLISTILIGTINGDFTEYKTFNYPYPVASITVSYDGKLRLA